MAGTRTIMVVNDDETQRELMAEILELEGYLVVGAPNGREALDRLSDGGTPRPALILLDMQMPVMDGIEFLERKRADRALDDVPVVVVTGGLPTPSLPEGAAGVVQMPSDLPRLLQVIQRYARG